MKARVEVYRRKDGKWDWRRIASNGQVVATSGGQGYTHHEEAREMAEKLNPDAEVVSAG